MADNRDDFIIAIRYALLKKGTKQKFSLFFLILFSILIIVLDKFSIGPINSTRALLNDFIYRVTVVVSAPERTVSYLFSKAKDHINIYNQTQILEEEVKVLKINKYEILFLKTENKNLKTALDFKASEFKGHKLVIAARVIIDQKSPYLKSILVNKGVKHGISKGMTVFSQKYLIGTVIETNYLSARVLLITDLNSKIPSIIQDTDINAILAGHGSTDNLTLDYLPDDFFPEPNKIIYTSGKDGLLGAGLPLAETFLNNKGRLKVRALADPSQASIVHITKGNISKEN